MFGQHVAAVWKNWTYGCLRDAVFHEYPEYGIDDTTDEMGHLIELVSMQTCCGADHDTVICQVCVVMHWAMPVFDEFIAFQLPRCLQLSMKAQGAATLAL